jgi:hypothetical protein
MAGLAVLRKGLIGIVLPGMVFLGRAVVSHRLDWLVKALSLPGLFIFAIIALPWLFLVEHHYSGIINYFFVHHHFDLYLQTRFNNAHGAWFFPAVLLVGMLPWTVAPLIHWRSFLQASASPLRSLGFVWFAVVLIFCLRTIQTRRIHISIASRLLDQCWALVCDISTSIRNSNYRWDYLCGCGLHSSVRRSRRTDKSSQKVRAANCACPRYRLCR